MNKLTAFSLVPLTVAMFALGSASTAFAQQPSFDELDADDNGYISREEARELPCLSNAFDDVETESPLGLSRTEYMRAVAEHCARDEE